MRAIAVTTVAGQDSPGIGRLFHLSNICSANLIIIGDKKTPVWDKKKLPTNVHFFSVEDQNERWPRLSKIMPFNHYGRKNFAYLWAIEHEVEILLDTDDDNYSEADVFSLNNANYRTIKSNLEWINVYSYFGQEKLWPRGLPLDEAMKPAEETTTALGKPEWQCFQAVVDGDPDLDAIGRMLYPEAHTFTESPPLLLRKGQFCPTNSQATLWKRELIQLLYLPVTAPFRMTDIWRGMIISGYMRTKSYGTLFGKASIIQNRNAHNLLSDFEDEVIGHIKSRIVKERADSIWLNNKELNPNQAIHRIYRELFANGIVSELEIQVLESYLREVEILGC